MGQGLSSESVGGGLIGDLTIDTQPGLVRLTQVVVCFFQVRYGSRQIFSFFEYGWGIYQARKEANITYSDRRFDLEIHTYYICMYILVVWKARLPSTFGTAVLYLEHQGYLPGPIFS